MLDRLAGIVVGRPLAVVVMWAAVVVVCVVLAPTAERITAQEPASMLPDDEPYNRSLAFAERAFPTLAARTRTVLVFERTSGLDEADHRFIAELTAELVRSGHRVLSPANAPFLRSRLVSADGRAAMVVVNSDDNYVTARSIRAVEEIERLTKSRLPPGLEMATTGTGGLGRDLAEASQAALERTTWVTIAAVLAILLLVYRAPVAALVPLIAIGTSVFIAMHVLAFLALAGWSISNAERMFAVVLMFGAGTDFTLFWFARYQEGLANGSEWSLAARQGLARVAPAILVSAATTIAGLLMLTAAKLVPSHNAGKALAVVLTITLAAALSLSPALACLFRRVLFYPRKIHVGWGSGRRRFWPAVANMVVAKPGLVLVVSLLMFAYPCVRATQATFRYDTLGELPSGGQSARGRRMAESHFSSGQLFSTTLLLAPREPVKDGQPLDDLSRELREVCAAVPGVTDVWSLDQPLGRSGARSGGALLAKLARGQVKSHYVSDDPPAIRAELMLDAGPLSLEAMTMLETVRRRVEDWAAKRFGYEVDLYAIGPTPYIADIKSVADADWRVVVVLVTGIIWLIVVTAIRDVSLSIFMLAGTLLTYFGAIGLADVLFVGVLGEAGLDYKVKLFLFVVLVAVGQDYNLLLVTRLRQELEQRRIQSAGRLTLEDIRDAGRQTIVQTGGVISSCGVIMAATLGSLAATGLDLLQQLGVSFAIGILLDTFVVRPLLVPGFFFLRSRLLRGMGRLDRVDSAV